MKTTLFHLFIALCATIFITTGCKKAAEETPVNTFSADFYLPFGDLVASQTLSFQNRSVGYESAIWDFGDGTPTLQQTTNPVTHIYTAGGTYTVKLLVADAGGTRKEVSKTITVLALPRNGSNMHLSYITFSRIPQTCIRQPYYTVTDSINNIMSSGTYDFTDFCYTQLPYDIINNPNYTQGIVQKNTVYTVKLSYKSFGGTPMYKNYTIKPADFYAKQTNGLSAIPVNDADFGMTFYIRWHN